MTDEVFDVLSKILRGKPEAPANKAARLVLVEGQGYTEAGRATGATRQTVYIAVRRFKEIDVDIRTAYHIKK